MQEQLLVNQEQLSQAQQQIRVLLERNIVLERQGLPRLSLLASSRHSEELKEGALASLGRPSLQQLLGLHVAQMSLSGIQPNIAGARSHQQMEPRPTYPRQSQENISYAAVSN